MHVVFPLLIIAAAIYAVARSRVRSRPAHALPRRYRVIGDHGGIMRPSGVVEIYPPVAGFGQLQPRRETDADYLAADAVRRLVEWASTRPRPPRPVSNLDAYTAIRRNLPHERHAAQHIRSRYRLPAPLGG